MENLLTVSVSIFLLYLGFIILKFGIPKSLSQSFYLLEDIKHGLGYIFTIVLWGMAFTLLPVWLSTPIGEDWEFLKFLCCASLCFVGAAPRFLDQDSKVHTIAAITSAITGLLWILICTNFWPIIIVYAVLFTFLMFMTKSKNCYTFWAEMVMFFGIYYSLFLLMI